MGMVSPVCEQPAGELELFFLKRTDYCWNCWSNPIPLGELWDEGQQQRGEGGNFVTRSSSLGPFPTWGPGDPKHSTPLQLCLEASCRSLPPGASGSAWGCLLACRLPPEVPLSFLNRQENKQLIFGYYIIWVREKLIRKRAEGRV